MKFTFKDAKVFFDGEEIFQAPNKVNYLIEVEEVCIFLYEGLKNLSHQGQSNVLCINKQGKTLWTIAPAILGSSEKTDVYTALFWNKNKLKVFTWSGFEYTLDPKTGKLSERVYEK